MKGIKKGIPAAIVILAVLGIWYGVCELGIFNAYVLPSPGKVLSSFADMCRRGELAEDIGISMIRVIKGFSIAFVMAFILGMLRAVIPGSGAYFEYLVQFFRNVPQIGRASCRERV